MSGESKKYSVSFGGQSAEIIYKSEDAKLFLDFLLGDLESGHPYKPAQRYEIILSGQPTKYSFWHNERKLYFGESRQQMAYAVINELIYRFIYDQEDSFALHAAVLSKGNHSILVPGTSGSGKSTLAAALAAKGFQYHSDELALVSPNGKIEAFTRPLFLRLPSLSILNDHIRKSQLEFIQEPYGAVIPHRVFNPNYCSVTPSLNSILYVSLSEDGKSSLKEMSAGESCFNLIQAFVNARNIKKHGINKLAQLTRDVQSFSLQYRNTEDLTSLLHSVVHL